MKLTAIILLTASLQLSARGVSQTLTISLKNASLEMVFSEIHKQAGYSFFYEDGLLKNAKPVDVSVVKVTIAHVLDLCFANQPFTYKIVNNAVSIKRKEAGVQTSFQPALRLIGDPVTVSGRVTDPDGNPLAGANVKIKGTNIGTTTDNLGRFTIANLDENVILEISFVGHDSQTFPVKGKSFLTVTLVQRQSILDETVVIAYGTSSRRFTTGNIATVKAADIEKQPVQNPILALEGRVPGIEITQLSGMNGGGVNIRIQGRNSIRSGLEPLLIIDGVPYPTQLTGTNLEGIVQGGSPLNYINPADIESIDVLKDADATSIYGSRAANGAILITTKKGKVGRPSFSINLQQGWGKVTRKANMMNTQQYLEMRNEAFKNDGLIPSANSNATGQFKYAPDLTIWDTTQYTDWQKALIGGTAKYTNINASIAGGTNIIQYRIGTSFNRQTTVFPGNSKVKSGSLQFSINGATANQKFKIQLSGSYQINDNGLPGNDLTETAVKMEPDAPPLYNADGTLNWAPNATGISTWTNPLVYTLYKSFNNTTKNLVSSASLSYTLVQGLEIRSSFGYNNLQSNLFLASGYNVTAPENRPYTPRVATYGDRKMDNWIIEPQLNYKKKIGNHNLSFLLGSSLQQNTASLVSITGTGFNSDLALTNLASASAVTLNALSSSKYKYNAIFSRLNYCFKDEYIIDLTGRRDGSSRFGDNNKLHSFWSAGVAWIFTEKKWLQQHLPLLSFGKLRSSYGTTGNDQIGDYGYLSTYAYSIPPIPYQGITGLSVNSIPNPNLQWEETRKLQGGLDLGFLKDHILLNITYARNRSSNQLITYALPTTTGFKSIVQNFPALTQNTSWEFTINTVNIQSRTVKWTSSINLTIPRNKVIRFPNIEKTSYASGENGVIIGQPLGVIKTYRFGGLDPNTGGYFILDKNGNGTIDPDYSVTGDKYFILNNSVKFYGGVQNSITYRRFKLDFLFQFIERIGSNDLYYYNGSAVPGVFNSGLSNQPAILMRRWQKPGDNSQFARFSAKSSYLFAPAISDALYTINASYLRLKNVSLNWQMPDSWIRKLHIQNGNLYFSGQNLATISNYKGLDPETQSSTVLPPLQLWTLGLQLTL